MVGCVFESFLRVSCVRLIVLYMSFCFLLSWVRSSRFLMSWVICSDCVWMCFSDDVVFLIILLFCVEFGVCCSVCSDSLE